MVESFIWGVNKETGSTMLCTVPREPKLQEHTASTIREFHLPRGARLLVTSAGSKKIGMLHAVVSAYKRSKKKGESYGVHLGSGAEGQAWDIGSSIVVKEAGYSFHDDGSLVNMEALRLVCEEYGPGYIKIPTHYAVLIATDTYGRKKEYTVMQKAPGKLVSYYRTHEHELPRGVSYDKLRAEMSAAGRWINDCAKDHIASTRRTRFRTSDVHGGNVLVDFTDKNKEKPFTLWFIDQ